eukprot:7842174-Pyramimonas_sp.AAC.1
MSAWCWLVHLCGRASPRMLVRAAASWFGASDANAVAVASRRIPAGTSVRVVDLDGRGIMATPTTVDTMMMNVVMLVAMLITTTGQPVTAPMLITLATMTASSRR